MDLVKRLLVPLIVLGFVVAAAVSFLGGDTSKTLVAHFPRAISVYEGSDVRVLGVAVGTVVRVEPTGTDVTVTMTYDDEVKLPADARAVIARPEIDVIVELIGGTGIARTLVLEAIAAGKHVVTANKALPLMLLGHRGLVVEMTDGTRDYNRGFRLRRWVLLRPRQGQRRSHHDRTVDRARRHRCDDARRYTRVDPLGEHARPLRRHRGDMA